MSARRLVHFGLLGAALVFPGAVVVPSTVSAGILSKGTPEQKQRRDIAKQIAKYWFCVLKATAKCERDGGNSGMECSPTTGMATAPADPREKFAAALQNCDEKLDFNKKGSGDPVADYVAMTCPSLLNPVAVSVDAMQEASKYAIRYDVQQKLFAADAFCPQFDQSTDPAALACAASYLDVALRYWKAAFKCQEKCENDYSGKNGNGGRNNSEVCASLPDQSYIDCRARAVETATKDTDAIDPTFFGYLDGNVRYFDYLLYNSSCQ